MSDDLAAQPQPLQRTQRTRRTAQLATEEINPASRAIDRMSALEMVQVMNAEDATVARAVATVLPRIAAAIDATAARMKRGGRLIYMGAGTSGRLGALDAAECPPTFNVPETSIVGCIAGGSFALTQATEHAEDDAELGVADAQRLDVGAGDTVVGITASGRTPYVLSAVAYAKARGALTIGITCNRASPLEQAVDLLIAPVVGPEVIAGSTRLKAGTAQKMVLNMLSTGVMVLSGKTYENLMVDVQATNDKLRQRATAIVQRVTGVDEHAAAALLEATSGEVKTAILAHHARIAPDAARERLRAHDNVLRAALDATP